MTKETIPEGRTCTLLFTIIEAIKEDRKRKTTKSAHTNNDVNNNESTSGTTITNRSSTSVSIIDIAVVILSKTINYETKQGYFLVGDGSVAA